VTDSITIVGNIAGEIRHTVTAGGVPITAFRVASPQRRYDRVSGSWVEGDPNWFSVSAYRSLAVNAFASLQRGQRVIVTGRLKVRRWENGERSGIAVEIDADALGPDLLWGTASFQRLAGARDGQSGADTAGATDGEASEAAWHVPGTEEPASAPVSPAGLDGIASGHDAPQDAEWAGAVTPF
jgi:single-strand DNA-binding protein